MEWSRHHTRRSHGGRWDVSIGTRLEIEIPVYEYEQRNAGKSICWTHGKSFAFQDIKLFVDECRVNMTLPDSAVTLRCHGLEGRFASKQALIYVWVCTGTWLIDLQGDGAVFPDIEGESMRWTR
jgi:hypothetical protein